MKYLVALALLLSTSALAQDAAKPAEPAKQEAAAQPAPPRTEFYLKFDAADLQNLNAGIMELPKRVADPFLAKLNGQLQQQTQQGNEAAAKQAGVK
jgi:hypothetical protein